MKTKLLVFVLPLILGGCFSARLDDSVEEIPDIEKALAQLDGRSSVDAYFKVLDAVDESCYENNRTALAGLGRSMAKIEFGDERVDHLEGLKLLYSEATLRSDSAGQSQVSCVQVVADYRKAHDEWAQEEAEQQKYDDVMNLGEESN